jgi:hypothetical protein
MKTIQKSTSENKIRNNTQASIQRLRDRGLHS